MAASFFQLFVVLGLILVSNAQEYGQFGRGVGLARRRNNNNFLIAGSFLGGALAGSFLTARIVKKRIGKELLSRADEIERIKEEASLRELNWQREYSTLYKNYEKLEKETLERDYEEFKAPDTNNDDMISRQEFNIYVKKYLSSFPELSEKDFPKFDDFDLDGDGLVSFDEWQKFLYQQKLQESKKKGGKNENDLYSQLLNVLYEQSAKADGFNGLQKNLSNNKGNSLGRKQ